MIQPEGNAGAVASGTVLGETYELVRLIGQGGMGAVWEATHLRLPGKRVAVKLLLASVAAESEAFARFRREAEIASRLGHPNIVEVFDFNLAPSGAPYLVLELLQGQDLAARLRHGPLPPGEALPIARQIGAALAAAHHAGIVHRDLKPENVFLCPPADEGATGPRVKVLDFGISKITGSSTIQTQEQRVMGTPQYMAPEQAKGQNSVVDARTDVFALGAIVYEMLSGQPAFSGDNLAEVVFRVVYEPAAPLAPLVPGAPASVVHAVERALAKDPAARWPDVSSFIAALTGRPLATVDRGPLVPSLGDPRKSSEEAFAHTVASQDGDQAKAKSAETVSARPPEPGARPTPSAPPDKREGAYSPTVDAKSRDLPGPRAPTPELQAGTPLSQDRTVERPPGSRRFRVAALGALIGLALVGIAGGAWWLGRDGARPAVVPPALSPVAATPAPAAAPRDAALALAVAAADAAVAPPPVAPPDVAVAPPPDRATGAAVARPVDKKPAPRAGSEAGEAEPRAEDEGSARSFLDQAAAALAAGDAREAVRWARRSLNERPTVRAYSLMARAYCTMGDLGNARAQLPHLREREKQRVTRFCARYSVDLSP